MDYTHSLLDIQNWMVLHHKSYKVIFIIGLLLLFIFLIHTFTEKYRIPSVAGYVIIGTLFSASLVEQIPFFNLEFIEWYTYLINSFNFVTILAVSFISFTIGTSLSFKILKKLELEFTLIILFESIGAFVLVTMSMLYVGKPLYLAILLGAFATATAPAATVMILKEYGVQGEFSATLMIVLALDEALALVIFSFIEPISLITVDPAQSLNLINGFLVPIIKIFTAAGLGLIIGYFAQRYISFEHSKKQKLFLILLTVVGGSALTISLHISPLIYNLFVGVAFCNFAKRHIGVADLIDTITMPLYAIFFILAGTKIQITNIFTSSFMIIAIIYTLARLAGKIGGSSLGARLAKAPKSVQKYIGFGLMPQIGVALDLAYVVQRDFAHITNTEVDVAVIIFNIILFTSLFTEITGSFATEYALYKSGDIIKDEYKE
ncbi:MAG: cation:proton antiporter [Halanaerobiales bacterium]|nr:cation:proton antiporter [Halanaerobiales bacterium]